MFIARVINEFEGLSPATGFWVELNLMTRSGVDGFIDTSRCRG